jgi:hypothetical protein
VALKNNNRDGHDVVDGFGHGIVTDSSDVGKRR